MKQKTIELSFGRYRCEVPVKSLKWHRDGSYEVLVELRMRCTKNGFLDEVQGAKWLELLENTEGSGNGVAK